MKKLYVLLLLLAFTSVNLHAQDMTTTTTQRTTTKRLPTSNYFTLTPYIGAFVPLFFYADKPERFSGAGNFSVDLTYRINREVGFYIDAGVNYIDNQRANAFSFEGTAGPRYYFDSKSKSKFFVEIGGGVHSITIGENALNNFQSETYTDLMVTGGIGAQLYLTQTVKLVGKSRYHQVFATKSRFVSDGPANYISYNLGLEFRL